MADPRTDHRDAVMFRPIGIIHTPFADRVSAPRQSYVAPDVDATIVLEPGQQFEDALSDLAGWGYLWVLYCFHLNLHKGWRPKVLPPRSAVRRGVFSTRSPHRPNPIGMSVVKLVRVDGLSIHVRGADMVDGSPVLDIKPYVAAADSIPDARAGWLATADPIAPYDVRWSDLAREQATWLKARHGIDLVTPVERTLALGPEPHAYRRIRKDARGFRLAVKDWRVRFVADGTGGTRTVSVTRIETGYRDGQLLASRLDDDGGDSLAAHRELRERWPAESQ
jgi:tRNA-Thr(GGU) m(6)t(6)A37 methyltransferase TsaA